MANYIDRPTTYHSNDGWTHRAPISDEKCILICLRNSLKLDGMDKKQVARLVKEWQLLSDNTPAPPLPIDSIPYDGHN